MAENSPNMRSSTVYIYVYIRFRPTLHIRCYGREITKYTVKYGVYIYSSGRPPIYSTFGREITRYTVKYGVYIYSSGRPYIYGVMAG